MDPSDVAAVEFLARLLADREAGCVRTLHEYLALFPGQDETVAREFLAVHDAARADSAASLDAPVDEPARHVGPYRLQHELGRGGQGTVWLARDTRLDRSVALKLVAAAWLDGELPARLRREAEAASRLDHPGICALYDVGVHADVAYLAMRHIEGETLAAQLEARAAGERAVPPLADDLALVESLARALHTAHEAGVLHRDIKPANVMVTPSGDPVLLDFGLALEDQGDGPPLTLSGTTLGTPHYMAPERLDGRAADRRGDVWALGVMLYELVAGRRPFEGATREALVKAVTHSEPARLGTLRDGVPRDLDVIVRTALCKQPDCRYASALDLAEDLRRLAQHEPILARPAGPLLRLKRWARRQPVVAGLLAALFVVLSAALLVTLDLLDDTRATLADKNRLLHEVTQLSDLKIVLDLLAEEQSLWPAEPQRVPVMDAWLRRGHAVQARLPEHRDALERLHTRLGARRDDALPDAASLADPADLWRLEQLRELTARLEAFPPTLSSVQQRRDFAADLERRTLEAPAAAWRAAAARVAADPRFEGFELAPQLGLVPLGPDPDTGLEEFAQLHSGAPAERGDDGRVHVANETGMVFVLVPGGLATVGARLPDADSPHGSPFVDEQRGQYEVPVETVALDPYLLSKFEITQGQWMHVTGDTPSDYREGTTSFGFEPDSWARHPVERVSWLQVTDMLRRLGLVLPTEAQWEYAARAGTTTPHWTGVEVRSLDGAENLADRFACENGAMSTWACESETWDGHVVHAPVGSLRGNPWGFHDMLGNVAEWVIDGETYGEFSARPGDGLRWEAERDWRAFRGGAFSTLAVDARSSVRHWHPKDFVAPFIGARAACPLRDGDADADQSRRPADTGR